MTKLNPDVLRWARETADLPLDEAARKVGLRDSGKGTATERLRAIEAGREEPTRTLVRRMAEKYRRPLLALYLPEPPDRPDRGEDFRTLPDDYREEEEALVDALLRDVRVRQKLIRGALEEEEEAVELSWVGTYRVDDGIEAAVRGLETILGMTHRNFRAVAGVDAAFDLTRTRAEEAGVFVLLVGDLGSHHTSIDVDVFRGFALADPAAPFIVVNDRDARVAWSFTLLHEFVHLMLGVTAISAGTPVAAIESFCNTVASEFLISGDEIEELAATLPSALPDIATALGEVSNRWNVSRSLLAYRLFQARRLNRGEWNLLRSQFEEEWSSARERTKEAGRESDGGPNYYVVRRHRLGPRLIRVTSRMLRVGALTTTRAGQVLGVRAKNVGRVLSESGT